jgi:hypothetical protein
MVQVRAGELAVWFEACAVQDGRQAALTVSLKAFACFASLSSASYSRTCSWVVLSKSDRYRVRVIVGSLSIQEKVWLCSNNTHLSPPIGLKQLVCLLMKG